MRFYLASSFDMRARVQVVCDELEAAGHVVPVQWWDHTASSHEAKGAPGSDDEFYRRRDVQATAARDFGGVTVCEAFILVAHPTEVRKFNGAMVELGYALALGKPCFALGRLDRSAMFAHVQRVESVKEALARSGATEEAKS